MRYLNHFALAEIAATKKPKSYLEVGVYQGESLEAVLNNCMPERVVLVDIWNYRGVRDHRQVAALLNFRRFDGAEFRDGDSHQILPGLAGQQFDLIHIDGDHSEKGAMADLVDAWPLLAVGGTLVFDDLLHNFKPHMQRVFDTFVNLLPSDKATVECRYDRERADGWLDGVGLITRLEE